MTFEAGKTTNRSREPCDTRFSRMHFQANYFHTDESIGPDQTRDIARVISLRTDSIQTLGTGVGSYDPSTDTEVNPETTPVAHV
jgi:hypothetical protein